MTHGLVLAHTERFSALLLNMILTTSSGCGRCSNFMSIVRLTIIQMHRKSLKHLVE